MTNPKTVKSAAKKSYYTLESIEKMRAALREAKKELDETGTLSLSVPMGNVKMGAIPSVSTLPFITCPGCCGTSCGVKCYAAKIALLRPAVMRAYARNTALALYKPELYFKQLDATVSRFTSFRLHVSGDIINAAYFENVVKIAAKNPHCKILMFTKRYNVVNDYINARGALPENLKVLFSGWQDLKPDNPHSLPETAVIYPGDTVPDNWKICGGNCFECLCRGCGCWETKNGETIAFHLH